MKRSGFFLIMAIFCLVISSCASNSKIAAAKLNIVIVDENNSPVKDFEVRCRLKSQNDIDFKVMKTGENGAVVFNKVNPQNCVLFGNKDGYTKLENVELDYNQNCEVFYCKVYSCDYILNLVEECYSKGDVNGGFKLLDSIYYKENSSCHAVVLYYQAFGYKVLGSIGKAKKALNKSKNSVGADLEESCEVLEDAIDNEHKERTDGKEAVSEN